MSLFNYYIQLGITTNSNTTKKCVPGAKTPDRREMSDNDKDLLLGVNEGPLVIDKLPLLESCSLFLLVLSVLTLTSSISASLSCLFFMHLQQKIDLRQLTLNTYYCMLLYHKIFAEIK